MTHPTAGRRGGTLVNRLLGMGVPLAPAGGTLRPGIVHRLDAGTSGLLVVAKTDEAYAALRRLFHDHAVERAYLALVRGGVANDAFAVDAPLGTTGVEDRGGRDRRHAGRRPRFEVRERFDGATLLEAVPRTGRTHQIRVHLAAIGHPILGDRAYGGGGDDARALGTRSPVPPRLAHLSFTHPITRRTVTLDEGLPEDLRSALDRLHERLA